MVDITVTIFGKYDLARMALAFSKMGRAARMDGAPAALPTPAFIHPPAHPSASPLGNNQDSVVGLSVAEQFQRPFIAFRWGGQETEMRRETKTASSQAMSGALYYSYNRPFCWLHPRPQYQGVVKKKRL